MNGDKKFDKEESKNEMRIPRRGFLQRVSLITGAFLAGVFRIDEAFGTDGIHCFDGQLKHYKCCSLCCDHDPTCKSGQCNTYLIWLCPDGGVMYKCIECYSIDYKTKENPMCQNPKLCQYVVCSRAQGPNESEPFN